MAVLKTQCPECDAKIRLTVDGAGDHEVKCLKCGHAFTAELEPDAPVKGEAKKTEAGPKPGKGAKPTGKSGSVKKSKAAALADDEDEEERPRKKKKSGADDQKKKLVLAGVAVGVLLVGGLAAVVIATSGGKTAPQADAAPETGEPTRPAPAPVAPGKGPNAQSASNGPSKLEQAPMPRPKFRPRYPGEVELATTIPPPPKVRLSGSLVPPVEKPVVQPPAVLPLAPDEDPFVRAKEFKLEEKLPELPKLPERGLRPVLTLDSGGHTAFVTRVFFTPAGDRLVTVGQDKAVRIWDPATNETVKTLRFPAGPGDEGSLIAAAMARSGKRLAVAGIPLRDVQPGRVPIHIVSPETGATVRRIDAARAPVNCMHFSNEGDRLAVGCVDASIQVFNVNSGTQIGMVQGAGGADVKFNPQSKTNFVASLGPAGRVLLLDVVRGSKFEFKVDAGSGAAPTRLAWTNDGKRLAVGCSNGVIAIYGLDGKPFATLPALTAAVEKERVPVRINDLQFLPGDNELAVVGMPRYAAIVDATTGKERLATGHHPNTVTALDVSDDGKRVVSCGGNHHDAVVWGADDGKVLHRMAGPGASVRALAWSKDGRSIAWGNQERKGGEEDGVLEHTFRLDEFGLGGKPDPDKYVQTVRSDEGVGLLTRSAAGVSAFLIQTPGRAPQGIIIPRETIYSATLIPKGNAVVAGGIADIYLINPATLKPSRLSFVGHTGNVLCVTPSPDGRYFATGSNDQTIRIWQRDHEEPLLSIFVADREWIAWTPQGYYSCSPQGERLMAWQVNGGARGPQVHPAERFRASLYQPAMLKYLVPVGDLPRAMAMARKFDKALVGTTNVADVLPPEVTLDGFTEAEVKVEKDTLAVRATAKGTKHPITSMRLLVNGRPFQGPAGVKRFTTPQPLAEASWEVPLVPGTHTFAVIADTGVSRGMSKLGVAVRPGEPPKPNLYVLAMGVSTYPTGINPLNYCATDAEILVKAFQEKSKTLFGKIEVKVVTDKQCTKKGMLDGLDWLKSKMTPQDVGVVSFSGHGGDDPFGGFYLIPADVDPEDMERTSLTGSVFKGRLDAMPGRLIAILDACRSGMVAEKTRHPSRGSAFVRDLTAEDSGVIVMCASLGSESAIESRVCKAGFYTLALVEGMSGHGDVDGDGVVYLHELDLYARTRVRQLSLGRQNPTFSRPPSVRLFPIAKPDKPPES